MLNPYVGRLLRALIEPFNLTDTHHEGTTRVARGYEVAAKYHQMNLCTLVRPHVLGADGLQESDFDTLSRASTDPFFTL